MHTREESQENTCRGDCSSCSSGKETTGVLPPRAAINVKHVVLVLSGKGGVGKSTVAVNLAMALSHQGYETGLLDLDIHGPNIGKMLGIEDRRLECLDARMEPIRFGPTLRVISMAFVLPDTSTPVVWRGPMKMSAIQQFLADVNWGSLDYLIVDLPPGTGDEALSIVQLAPNVRGAVIVTTPQDVATLDAQKAIRFVGQMGIPVIGVVENMSGMICPHCGEAVEVFGRGGGEQIAKAHGVPFLGRIPLDPEVRKGGDAGRPCVLMGESSPTVESVHRVMEELIRAVKG